MARQTRAQVLAQLREEIRQVSDKGYEDEYWWGCVLPAVERAKASLVKIEQNKERLLE